MILSEIKELKLGGARVELAKHGYTNEIHNFHKLELSTIAAHWIGLRAFKKLISISTGFSSDYLFQVL